MFECEHADTRLNSNYLQSYEYGFPVAAKNGWLHDPLDPLMAKVMSCRKAFKWLKASGYSNVVLEIDALNVFNALLGLTRIFLILVPY